MMRGMSPWGLTRWRRCPPQARRRGRRAAGRWGSTSGCDQGNAARCCDGSGPSMTGCPNLTRRQTEGGREMMVTWRDISHNPTDHITPSCFITTLASRQLVQHHDCRRGQEVACPVEKAKTRLKVLLQFWLFIILKVCICVNAVSDLQVRKWKTGTRKW